MGEYFHSILPFKISWVFLCFNISYGTLLTELDGLDIKPITFVIANDKCLFDTCLHVVWFPNREEKGLLAFLKSDILKTESVLFI